MQFFRRTLRFEGDVCEYWYGHNGPDAVVEVLGSIPSSRFLVVCDPLVEQLYGERYAERLEKYAPSNLLVHPVGEKSKTLRTVETLGNKALEYGADRRTAVVAVGGGLTGNLSGLLAALLFRGISFAHVPTTLLAMLDSVFSQKQAVNSRHGKNAFGAFRLPKLIVADTSHIGTLPADEVRSSLCEVIKNALAIAPEYIDTLKGQLNVEGCYVPDSISSLIDFSLRSKQTVMESDRYETGPALVCEYGHTVGHVLEHVGGIAHGSAIGVGMLVAAELSAMRGGLTAAEVSVHYDLLERNGSLQESLLTTIGKLDARTVVDAAMFDNKKGYLPVNSDAVAMVLLERLGQPYRTRAGVPLVAVHRTELRTAIERVQELMAVGVRRFT